MGVVKLDADPVLGNVVEAMLPRFSDPALGLLVSINMSVDDFGYGENGSTQERDPLSIWRMIHFLLVRPSNYTKVYLWEPALGAKGLDLFPIYAKEPLVWRMECDHDSCWRDAMGNRLSEVYFECCGKFDGRVRSGKEMRPCDLSTFVHFENGTPQYVRLTVYEQVHPNAMRYSNESRLCRIKFEKVAFDDFVVKNGALFFK